MDEVTWFDNRPWRAGTPLDAYPTITDFTVEPAPDVPAMFGVRMQWVSPTHGILSVFPWWDHLDKPGSRLDDDDWSVEWTQERPFIDADQNFAIDMWAADDHVYVVSGLSPLDANWYRVPRARFDSELARFRAGLAQVTVLDAERPQREFPRVGRPRSRHEPLRRWLLIGAVSIVLFDVVTALAARPMGFEYGSLPGLVVSTAIHAVPAFLAAREAKSIRIGVLVGAGIALFDATFGWAASWLIGPGAPADPAFRTPEMVALAIVVVVGIGAVLGLIAGLLARGLRRTSAA